MHALLLSAMIAALTGYAVHPSAPQEPWWHRLACSVPRSAIAGTVVTLAATA